MGLRGSTAGRGPGQVRTAGYDANLLLNVGPQPDGTMQPEYVTTLEVSERGRVSMVRRACGQLAHSMRGEGSWLTAGGVRAAGSQRAG